MRILVVTSIQWADNISSGNTLSNWFEGMPNCEFASIYRRVTKPRNKACKKYYQITLQSIIKHFFNKEKIGELFYLSETEEITLKEKLSLEKKIVDFIHRFSLSFLTKVEDFFFVSMKWDNKKFEKFITEFSPDILFTFVKGSKADLIICDKISRLVPTCKIVGYFGDDVYNDYVSQKTRKVIEQQVGLTSKIYAVSDKLAEDYSLKLNRSISVLKKGCVFTNDIQKKNHEVLRIVYAGNLLYGRDKTLAKLAQIMKRHNSRIGAKQVVLEIYTTTQLGDAQMSELNIEGVSQIMGSRQYSEIKKIFDEADIVLLVESFEPMEMKKVRYSFSTKITDCLQSTSAVFSIAPSGIYSSDFVKKIPGAFWANTLEEIEPVLNRLCSEDIYECVKLTRQYAIQNFEIGRIQRKLFEDFSILNMK